MEGRGMFDFEEFYQRMADTLPLNARIAEVGVGDGASIIYLAEALLNQGKDKFSIQIVDNLAYGGHVQLGTIMNNVCKADLASFVTIRPVGSLDASCLFPDSYFDFVFIDASHKFEETKADIRVWYPKMIPEGILAGHDYNSGQGSGVKEAVDLVVPRMMPGYVADEVTHPNRVVLHAEKTRKGHGVWWFAAHPRLRLN